MVGQVFYFVKAIYHLQYVMMHTIILNTKYSINYTRLLKADMLLANFSPSYLDGGLRNVPLLESPSQSLIGIYIKLLTLYVNNYMPFLPTLLQQFYLYNYQTLPLHNHITEL
jgi:hypothetical protein